LCGLIFEDYTAALKHAQGAYEKQNPEASSQKPEEKKIH
jgi:hypothetical protein